MEPVWLTEEQVMRLHAASLNRYGGSTGLRDRGLLLSAIARPRHLWSYHPDAALTDLAASYAFGLAKNHAFIDGNKRTAALAAFAFLFAHDLQLTVTPGQFAPVIEDVASGQMEEAKLAEWLAAHMQPA